MTRDEVAAFVIARVLEREGAIGQVPGEAWVTRFGQTPAWLHDFRLQPPNTPEQAAANYRAWLDATGLVAVCDDIAAPDSLVDIVIDVAVMSGYRVAVRSLQAALGVAVDGEIGPVTRTALARLAQTSNGRRHAAALVMADSVRLMGRLITDAPGQYARDAAGWLGRRAAQIASLS